MRWGRHWWLVLLCIGLCRMVTAQAVVEAGLRKLPVSIGDNTVITRKAGESWVSIGIREFVGYDHLRLANSGNINTAHTLFIPGRHQVSELTVDGLVVNIPELMDFRWVNGKVVAWYPISIGRITSQWHTPLGNLRVISLEKNPIWNRPDWAGGGQMPPGPRNPLGDRWIGLDRPGYGLHGTDDPTSIGRIVSHGCIRHFPPHIHQLFDSSRIGMPVIITYQTITVGVDSGVVYMAVFPDIYARGSNVPRNARQQLANYGLDGALSEQELEQRLAQADGIARPLLGSNTKVSVNLLPTYIPLGPTYRKGATYLPISTMAAILKAQLTWDAGTNTATLTRGIKRISFSTKNGAFSALGNLFVPISRVVSGLGGTTQYSQGNISISIY